jgi:hypothetical protein
MPQPRSSQISLSDTPYYHCVSRCVRRSFLCGVDHDSGQSYEHRRGWVEQGLLFLSSVFAIDICAYAVMSNHVHVVLHVDIKQVMVWTDNEVVRRWHLLHKGTLLTQLFVSGDTLSQGQKRTLDDTIVEYRRRLHDISCCLQIFTMGGLLKVCGLPQKITMWPRYLTTLQYLHLRLTAFSQCASDRFEQQ